MEDPGKTIRRLRKQRGWTMKRLSAKSGVSLTSINKYELGKACPRTNTFIDIIYALGYDLEIVNR